MIENEIRRDILIDASAETVWRTITAADQLAQWFCDRADLELRPGAAGAFTFTVGATGEVVTADIEVEAVDPPHRFAYRWGGGMLVEFTLTPEGEGTRLAVVESGWTDLDWPDEQKRSYIDDHGRGWSVHMPNARAYAMQLEERSTSR